MKGNIEQNMSIYSYTYMNILRKIDKQYTRTLIELIIKKKIKTLNLNNITISKQINSKV